MSQTIYASFGSIDFAERAAGALLDHGVAKEDLSVVSGRSDRQVQEQEVGISEPPISYVPVGVGAYGSGAYAGQEGLAAGAFASGMNPVDYNPAVTDKYVQDSDVSVDSGRGEEIAKSGITTTTPEDAGVGALKGTGVGLGLGLLAGLAALVVPGVGLVLGAGALAGALGVAALTTAAGAATGGLIGFLKDQGVAESDAVRYNETVGSGGALLAVSLPSNGVDLQETELLLNKYGATDISTY